VDTTRHAGVVDSAARPAPDTSATVPPIDAAPAPTGTEEPAHASRPNATPAMPWVDPAAKPQPQQTPVQTEAPVETTPVEKEPEPKPAKTQAEEPERFREGYLLVMVEPSAQVYVNGVYRGPANPRLRLTLNAGMHTIECRGDSYAPYSETMRIIAGETSQRTVILQKLKGIISLATNEGAEFYVDGMLIGITPIKRPIEVTAGSHTLMIKKDNHFTWSSEVTVEANATLPLRITLSPRY
jgi:hypothetical protein